MVEMRKDLSQQLNEVRGKNLKDIALIRQDIHTLKDNDIKKSKETNANQYNLIKIMAEKLIPSKTNLQIKTKNSSPWSKNFIQVHNNQDGSIWKSKEFRTLFTMIT